MKKIFVALLIMVISAGQVFSAEVMPCNGDMMSMSAHDMDMHENMDHGQDHMMGNMSMAMMSMDAGECCGEDCTCPEALFSGLALPLADGKAQPITLSLRISLIPFSIIENHPGITVPPPNFV